MSATSLLATLTAPYPADVLLFHPVDPHIFVVGTYLLDEATRQRHGKICTYRLAELEVPEDVESNSRLLDEINCDAVLDMKWYSDLLYVCHSTGSISIYQGTLDASSTRLNLVQKKTVLDADVLIMSLSLSDRGVLTSHSDGSMAMWTHDLQEVSSWHVSDLEVWIQAWGRDTHVVYSGSDDGAFAGWDTRVAGQPGSTATFTNRKSHGAGITAILPYGSAHDLLTGSYDDCIRKFDLRSPHRCIDKVKLGGGVWRIIPTSEKELMTCCMYNGAKIVKDESFNVVKHFENHESIVYGGDAAGKVMGTCSFYDKKICIWT